MSSSESASTHPVFSIIMPSYNAGAFIREAIQSVLNQTSSSWELLIIDGGSTDGTLDILKSLQHEKVRWLSEPDQGQSDAINKGFRMARGEILAWLNADDLYEPDCLQTVEQFFAKHPEAMWVSSPATIINRDGRSIRRFVSWYKTQRLKHYRYSSLLTENYISQMGTFFRRQALAIVGDLDTSLHYAMDYDLWLRLGKKFTPGIITKPLSKFRMYDTSKSVSGFRKQFDEDLQVARKYADRAFWPIFFHQVNRLKIVTIYETLTLVHRFARLRPTRQQSSPLTAERKKP